MIFIALLTGMAGMLWETNDLISENPNHPLIAPEASLMNLQYDEYGDPYARSERIKPLSYAKIWSSPLTQVCLAFIVAIVIGSLFRSLIRGVLTLLAVISLAALLVGRENLIDQLMIRDTSTMLDPAKDWLVTQSEIARQYFVSSLHSTLAVATGLFMGMKK
ncbi:MAG: hypothetical protein P1U89_14080 [Verrucomicrobiales bacterium]|nr:hypothetical protein [Verrucomicrobiales bacterium]